MNIQEDLKKIYYEKGFLNKEIVSKYEFNIKTGKDKEVERKEFIKTGDVKTESYLSKPKPLLRLVEASEMVPCIPLV